MYQVAFVGKGCSPTLTTTRTSVMEQQQGEEGGEEEEIAAMIESVKRDGDHLSLACRPFGRIPGAFLFMEPCFYRALLYLEPIYCCTAAASRKITVLGYVRTLQPRTTDQLVLVVKCLKTVIGYEYMMRASR